MMAKGRTLSSEDVSENDTIDDVFASAWKHDLSTTKLQVALEIFFARA